MDRQSSTPPHLHELIDLNRASNWLGICRRDLSARSKGAKGAPAEIPGFWIGERTVLFHPATIIAHLAERAGVSHSAIAAALGMDPDALKNPNQK